MTLESYVFKIIAFEIHLQVFVVIVLLQSYFTAFEIFSSIMYSYLILLRCIWPKSGVSYTHSLVIHSRVLLLHKPG